MASPLSIDIPHTIGRAEARRRIAARLGDLQRHLPGSGTVSTEWTGEDRLALKAHALGQDVAGTVDIEETVVRVTLALPFMLSVMSGPITAAIRSKGETLLADRKA